jgi:hypothetical protein
MKKLRALFQSIIFLFVLSFFSPTVLVNAQSPEEPTTVTQISTNDSDYQAYQSRTVTLFNTARDGINNLITTTRNLPISQQEKDAAISAYNSYLAVVGTASRTYTSQIGGYIGSSTLPPQGQRLALDEALRILAQGKGSLPQNTNALNIYSSLESALQTAKTAAAEFAAGSSGGDALTNAANDQIAGAASAAKKNITKGVCSVGVFSDMNLGACVSEFFSWVIKNTLMELAGWFLWASANMFNFAVTVAVLDFKSWAPDALYPLWIVIRQIVSLLIVFAGLYLGFMYILGREDKFEKYIPWVVIFALFVNFSYPLVRTAVDISNIVSLKLYTVAVGPEALTAGPTSTATAGAKILGHLGLQDLAASVTTAEGAPNVLKNVNTISGALLFVIFVFYAAYIFFIATGIIVMRTLALVFLIIASPLLFVDSVIPMLGDQAMRLRKIFFEQLAVAPVFMIMLALSLNLLSILSGQRFMGSSVNMDSGDKTIVTFFTVLVMLGMLHLTIKVTREVAGKVGNFAGEALGKVGGFAGGVALGAATGGVGLLARGTVGRVAAAATQTGGTLDRWTTKNGVAGSVGRRLYGFTDSLAKSSYDPRNTAVVQRSASKLGLSNGMGAGVKKGYQELQEERAKRKLEVESHIKTRMERDGKSKKDIDSTLQNYRDKEQESIFKGGSSLFLGKYGKDVLQNKTVDEGEAKLLNAYKGERGLSNKKMFKETLTKELSNLGEKDSTRKETVQRALREIEKQEKDVDDQVQDAFEKYSVKTGQDKQQFLTGLQREVREGVIQKDAEGKVAKLDTGKVAEVARKIQENPQGASSDLQTKTANPAQEQVTQASNPITETSTAPSSSNQNWSQYDAPAYQRKEQSGNTTQTPPAISSSMRDKYAEKRKERAEAAQRDMAKNTTPTGDKEASQAIEKAKQDSATTIEQSNRAIQNAQESSKSSSSNPN